MQRRKFFKTAAAAGAGAFVLPRFSIGKPGPSANSNVIVRDLAGCSQSSSQQ